VDITTTTTSIQTLLKAVHLPKYKTRLYNNLYTANIRPNN